MKWHAIFGRFPFQPGPTGNCRRCGVTSQGVQVSQLLLFVVVISDRSRIGEDSDSNSNDFTDVSVLSAWINDDNGFSDSIEEDEAEKGGVELYQYKPALESDSDDVRVTQLEAGGTAVHWYIDRLHNTEW